MKLSQPDNILTASSSRYFAKFYLFISIVTFSPYSAWADDVNHYASCLKLEITGQYQEAISHCEQAAQSGTKEAAFALGRMYRDKLTDSDNSFQWFLNAAKQGDTLAQYEVGIVYLKGNTSSISVDTEEAKKWFLSAADKDGSGNSAYELYKLSTEENEALQWLQKAVDAGLPQAAKVLADAYAKGSLGLTVDMQKSQTLLNQANQFSQ